MPQHDVLVIGGGISGASFAYHAARAGRGVLLLEAEETPGGCLSSVRPGSGPAQGYWFELGAHTCYNSYGAFLELLEGVGLLGELVPRGKPVLRFLDGDRVLPGKNLGLLLRRFEKLELLRALPRWFGADAAGHSVREHYSRLVGPTNYARVLGPMLSAVPSQTADDFPADMLFKKRERRKEVLRSYTLPGGLRTAVERALARPGIEVRSGAAVSALRRDGDGFAVTVGGGWEVRAEVVALAVPPGAAASLLADVAPTAAAAAGALREATVESLGFCVRADRARVPYATFLIPLDDAFHSIVTRDVVPDPDWRAFTFHFKPGMARDDKLERAAAVLGLEPADLHDVTERRAVLPSPVVGHAEKVDVIDQALAGGRLAVTGNWFGGLAIEDCVLRSRAEAQRVLSGRAQPKARP